MLSLTSLLPAARGRRQEGLASLPGYLAVWWLGDAIGAVLRPRAAARSWWRALAELGLLTLVLGAGAPRTPPPRARLAPPPTRAVALTPGLAPLCRLLCAASFIADAAVQRASRRLCNLAYSLWVVAQARRAPEPSCTPARPAAVPACSPQTLLVLCICLATSLVCPAPAPDLLGALNRHLLGVFLLANLLTGAVNLTLPTMHASGPFGLCVLCAYMTAVCAAACAAEGPRRDATVRAPP